MSRLHAFEGCCYECRAFAARWAGSRQDLMGHAGCSDSTHFPFEIKRLTSLVYWTQFVAMWISRDMEWVWDQLAALPGRLLMGARQFRYGS